MSLGIDLIPHKICSLNCVYCECGATTSLTEARKEYVPVEAVEAELEDYFANHPDPDYLTFSGNGEPTLHIHLGRVIGFLKKLRPAIKVAVLTNGTLLKDPVVRTELMKADLVLPSLDAAIDTALRKVNRPTKNLTVREYIDGLLRFSREFKGEIWMEILILPGFNDDRENLEALRKVMQEMNPARVQLNTLDRPGTIDGLIPASDIKLREIADFMEMEQVEIIAPPKKRGETKAYRDDVENAILGTISRRPCTLGDLENILGLHVNELNKYLGVLEETGKITVSRQARGIFYQLPGK